MVPKERAMTKTGYENIPVAPPEHTAVALVIADNDTTFMDEPAPPARESAPTMLPAGTLLGRMPVQMMVCPNCSETGIRTRTRTYPALLTWILVAIGAVVFCPLCWIPLVVDPLKQTDHYCQSCGEKIAEIGPMEDCCVREEV